MVSAAWWRKADNTATTLSPTDNEVELTAWGGLLQRVLRLTGAVLLGGLAGQNRLGRRRSGHRALSQDLRPGMLPGNALGVGITTVFSTVPGVTEPDAATELARRGHRGGFLVAAQLPPPGMMPGASPQIPATSSPASLRTHIGHAF
jgi:hypothetical protein